MKILVLNAGSSSQKSTLYDIPDSQLPDEPLDPLWSAEINWIDSDNNADLQVTTALGVAFSSRLLKCDRKSGLLQMLQTLWSGNTQVIENAAAIDAVGHRVVHGGQHYGQPVRIDAQVKTTIAALSPLAPTHNPVNLEGIEIIEELLDQVLGTGLPQFAIFDTAFHHPIPDAAAIYPGPYAWVEAGIRRYGFHGISHAYCADRISHLLGRTDLKLITCHLGNGCSLAAIRDSKSVDTTMGFTPLEGLMMGSRSGSIDPGILLYLMREQGYDGAMLDKLLHQQSGLKGLSGISHDLRSVKAALQAGNPRAQLAWDVYIHRIRSGIGSMLMSLGGLDALVFTAGVGEHDAEVRSAVCQGLGFLGVNLDETLNRSGQGDRSITTQIPTQIPTPITTLEPQAQIWVLQTQENWQIAKSCWKMMH